MILCSKLKNGLCKIVTKSQVVTKVDVTKSRLHCTAIQFDLETNFEMNNFFSNFLVNPHVKISTINI